MLLDTLRAEFRPNSSEETEVIGDAVGKNQWGDGTLEILNDGVLLTFSGVMAQPVKRKASPRRILFGQSLMLKSLDLKEAAGVIYVSSWQALTLLSGSVQNTT
jgi:hypothetical protein